MENNETEEKKPTEQVKNPPMALLALILGGAGIIMLFVPYFGFCLGVAGLILGIVALKKKLPKNWMAIIGIVLGALAILIASAIMGNSSTPPKKAEEPTPEIPVEEPVSTPEVTEKEEAPESNKATIGEPVVVKTPKGESLYTLTLNNVYKVDERNQFDDSNPAEVIAIDYYYENHAKEGDLYISVMNFKVIDETGAMCSSYPNVPTNHPQSTPIGANCTSQMFFGLPNASSKVKILFYDNIFDSKTTAEWEIDI